MAPTSVFKPTHAVRKKKVAVNQGMMWLPRDSNGEEHEVFNRTTPLPLMEITPSVTINNEAGTSVAVGDVILEDATEGTPDQDNAVYME